MKGIREAVVGALVLAALSTCGDYLWANVIPHHRPIYGVIHGTLLFLVVGEYLGALARKTAIGALGGALIGFLAAGSFYVLSPVLGYSAMFLLYVAVWVALGLLNGRVLQPARGAGVSAEPERMGIVLTRSVLAAIGTGIAFYAISGIWFPFNPHGWDYAVHFLSWTVAYLPAFAALLIQNNRSSLLR